jgi:endonuclease/exonuclease/phosphatase family metal-dependent hydrolase
VAATGALAVPAASAKPVDVTVMSRNLYLGADLTPAIAAPNPAAAMAAAGDIYRSVIDTNFTARSKLIAREIADSRPHLIGLQEVSLWRRGQRGAADGPETPATEVIVDYLDTLQHELDRLGLNYRVASIQREADIELPVDLDGDAAPEFDGRLTMFDVILARKRVKVLNSAHDNFTFFLPVPTALGEINVVRGWTSADVRMKRKRDAKPRKFRFVNTHLEAFSAFVRNSQAGELTGPNGAVNTDRSVILLGDLNSDPDDPTSQTLPPFPSTPNAAAYETIATAGFADRGVSVNTCCHDADLLDFPATPFDSRIDHVLGRGKVRELSSSLIGNDPALRTNTGLWPTDHGGVVAKLRVR